MKSAYQILGVPGIASDEDIDIAFSNIKLHYTLEYMAANADALQRFQVVKEAHALLKDPLARASHDRKLASKNQLVHVADVTPILQEPRRNLLTNPFVIGIVLIGLLIGSGMYMSKKRAEAAQQIAAAELAAKRLEAVQAERERIEARRLAAARAAEQSRAEAQERNLRNDGRQASAFLAANNARISAETAQSHYQQAQELRRQAQDRRIAEQAQRDRDRMAQYAAQNRLYEDQVRLRNLCMLNYGRPNC